MLASFNKIPRGMRSSTQSLPAPTGGWNVRDAWPNMSVKDAVKFTNWWPMPSDVMVRKGYSAERIIQNDVETVAVYEAPTSAQLFGIANGNVYEASNTGTASASSVTGLNTNRFQTVNYTSAAGVPYLYMVSGEDAPLMWNGTAWANPAITGATATSFAHINVFKSRLWFVQKDTLKAWYLNAGAIQGTATAVDLSAFTVKGGYLMAMATWTLDAGAGVDDYAVFVTSEGEVIVYQGTDPSSSTTWAMKGRWELGSPLGRRCFIRYGGDVLIACNDGVVPLSKALISSRVRPNVALTDKIQGAMSTAASTYGANFGWDLLFYPKGSMVLLNVPVQENDNQQQYTMNSITGSWGQFTGVDANCWCLYNDEPYFGSNGFIGKFWDGLDDNDTNIATEVIQAFSYFGDRGRLKHFKEARPILSSNGTPSILAVLEVDYQTSNTFGQLSFSPTAYGVWDSGLWDTAVWGGDLNIIRNWQTLGNIGTAAAIHFYSATQGIELHWIATDFLYERGGVI